MGSDIFSVCCQEQSVGLGTRNGSLSLWDSRVGRTVNSVIVKHHSPVLKVCAVNMRDGADFLCSHADGSVTLTDTRALKVLRNYGTITAPGLSSSLHWDMDAQTFTVADTRRAGVLVWPLHSARPATRLAVYPAGVVGGGSHATSAVEIQDVCGMLRGAWAAPVVGAAVATGVVLFSS